MEQHQDQQKQGRVQYSQDLSFFGQSPKDIGIFNTLDRLNNNEVESNPAKYVECSLKESEGSNLTLKQHSLQTSDTRMNGFHQATSVPSDSNNTQERSRLASLSSTSSSQTLGTPSSEMLSPSSPASSSSSSESATGQLPQNSDCDEGGGASCARACDIPTDPRLLLHRQSLPGDVLTEHDDALGELRQRLLYQEASGRKLSVDSSLAAAQRRVPTFVRTYREVAWKRVNKNHSKQKMFTAMKSGGDLSATAIPEISHDIADSQTPPTDLASAADVGGETDIQVGPTPRLRTGSSPEVIHEVDGIREYVNGQHIKRGRVPIFITADTACPRRFSADDLVSVDQAHGQWASRGRCLIIRPSHTAAAAADYSTGQQAAVPTENGGTGTVRDGQRGAFRRRRQDSSDYEFSLAEDDDDDDDDEDDGDDDDDEEEDYGDEEDEESASKDDSKDELFREECNVSFPLEDPGNSSSAFREVDSTCVPEDYLFKFSNNLHRLAMGNSTLKKTLDNSEQNSQEVVLSKALDQNGQSSTFPTLAQQNTPGQAAGNFRPTNPIAGGQESCGKQGVPVESIPSSLSLQYPTPAVPVSQPRRTSVCWTLARPVDGTLPVNLQGAIPIGVEFVQSEALDEQGEPLWFQKMIFPPGVHVSSTQWSANSSWLPAVRAGLSSSDPRKNRFLVRAEVTGADVAPSDSFRHHNRRVSDAFAPYNKNKRNGVHAPRVVTLSVLPHATIDEVEHAKEVNNHKDNTGHLKRSKKIPTQVNGLHRDVSVVSQNCVDNQIQQTGTGTRTFVTASDANFSKEVNATHIQQSSNRQPKPSQVTSPSAVGAAHNHKGGVSGTVSGVSGRGSKKESTVWRDILLSLSTEKSSVGVANWLLKGRGGSTVAIDNKIEQAMDLVKRHLMYAVREEVEILKQQIGEMMERIGQLEYENTLLKSEAKPETLSKLLLPRVSQAAAPQQIQMSSGGGGGGSVAAAVGGTAGVVVPSQQQQQQQQQQQSAVLAPQAQKPPTPSGQQTPGAMIPPQQVQTVASGTSTPTQQQQQHLVHQTSTQQPG